METTTESEETETNEYDLMQVRRLQAIEVPDNEIETTMGINLRPEHRRD